MKKLTIGLSVAALAIAGTAYAGQHGMRGDGNGDGVVTRVEAQAKSAEMFARMDANSDGKIDAADREARMGHMSWAPTIWVTIDIEPPSVSGS